MLARAAEMQHLNKMTSNYVDKASSCKERWAGEELCSFVGEYVVQLVTVRDT